MRIHPAALAAAILPAIASAPPAAAKGQVVEIAEYGLFITRHDGDRPGPETTERKIHNVVRYDLVRRTTCIRAAFGVQFGVTVREGTEGDAPAAPARIEIRHPPFVMPDGSALTLEAWPLTLKPTPLYNGFTFEHPYELVVGHWTIAVLRDGHLLARQDFDVVGPNEGCPAEVS